MNLGDYVVGGGGQVYDMILTIDRNIGPNMAGTGDYIPGTQSTSSIGGYQYLSFQRPLNPGNGLLPIDTSIPFNILWAYGPMTAGVGWSSVGYHREWAGHFQVNMNSQGNCDSATVAALQAAETPSPAKRAAGKKAPPKKAGKKVFPTPAPVTCAAGQTLCTSDLSSTYQCIVGACFYMPAVSLCQSGQTMCTAALQAQGANCIVGSCFSFGFASSTAVAPPQASAACIAMGKVLCTTALQNSGSNCVLNSCTLPPTGCGVNQVLCSAGLQASGLNCVIGSCVSFGG